MRKIIPTAIVLLGLCASRAAQDEKNPEPAQGKPEIVKELVKGSIHHRPHGKEVEWERITGKAQVVNLSVLRFSDGTPIELGRAPELNENATKQGTEFLRKLVDDQPVTSFGMHTRLRSLTGREFCCTWIRMVSNSGILGDASLSSDVSLSSEPD